MFLVCGHPGVELLAFFLLRVRIAHVLDWVGEQEAVALVLPQPGVLCPVPRPQHKWLIFIGCLITWLLSLEIAAAAEVLRKPPYALEHPSRAISYSVLLALLSFGALLANYRTYLLPNWTKDDASADAGQCATAPRYNVRLMVVGGALFALAAALLFWIFYGWMLASLGPGAWVFANWRSINLFTGVSATVPLLLLTLGLYGWFWYSLSGIVSVQRRGAETLSRQSC